MTSFRPRLATALALLIPLCAAAWASSLQVTLGLSVYTEQFLAIMLGLALAVAYIASPYKHGWRRHADDVLAFASIIVAGLLIWRYPVLQSESFFRPVEAGLLSLAVLVVVVEAARRSTAKSLLVILAFILLYAFAGQYLPGAARAPEVSVHQVLTFLGLDSGAVLGLPLIVISGIVVAFLVFGQMLQVAGGSAFISDIAESMMGGYRGGAGKIAIVGSALFGTVSGSAVSNVVSTGTITIPMMKNTGYRADQAGAIEAVASTGGQLMPPVMGAAAFLMAENLGVPFRNVALAAIVPAIIYYLAIFIIADSEAAKRGLAAVPASERADPRAILRRGAPILGGIALLVILLFMTSMPAELTAFCSAAAFAILALFYRYDDTSPSWRSVFDAIVSAGRLSVEIIILCAVAGMIIGMLQLSGLSFALTLGLVTLGQGHLILMLIAVAVICIILGMGMPSAAVYILVAVLAAPPLIKFGVDPMAAHMFVFYYGILSMITPPVAIAAFTAANIAGSSPMRTASLSCLYGWTAFLVPFLFVFSPTLLLVGAPLEIAIAIVTALIGVTLASLGLGGYFLDRMGIAERIGFTASGILALIPAGAFSYAWLTDVAGCVAGLALAVMHWKRSRAVATHPAAA